MSWPNKNALDACCRCGVKQDTPFSSTQLAKGKPDEYSRGSKGVLSRWQVNPGDPPQWICLPCREELEGE